MQQALPQIEVPSQMIIPLILSKVLFHVKICTSHPVKEKGGKKR